MRKITQDSVQAFFNNQPFKRDNTEVEVNNVETRLLLHGNIIAVRRQGELLISHCDWMTPTTKERLNGVLDYMNVGRIYQRNFIWYWKDGKHFEHGYNKV